MDSSYQLIQRATLDVDIVALADDQGILIDPAPLPKPLTAAALEVAEDLGLPRDWLNNGPSSGDGDLEQLHPTDEELLAAVAWSRSHDPSDGYLQSVRLFFREFGYEHLADRV